MNEFLKNIISDHTYKPNDAFIEIINKLMMKNKKGSDKSDGYLNGYDSETLFGGKIFRGNIYIFQYDAKNPSKYSCGGKDVYYTDNMPIVLVTGETQNTIRGINLNFCNKAVKTIILNMIQNLDTNFYNEGGAEKLAANKNLVISKKVFTFLASNDAEKIICEYLQKKCNGIDVSFMFRNYAITNIKNIRLIEPWQWHALPFLSYDGSIKQDTLDAIHLISGINNIKL